MDKDTLIRLYENMRLVCYQLPDFLNDFDIEFERKTDLDDRVLDSVKKSIKTCMSLTFDSTEFLYQLVNAEDYSEIQEIIEGE